MLVVGDKVCGRYEVVDVIGRRPPGVLYRAIDLEIGVDVALHVLDGELLPDAAARQKFIQRLERSKLLAHAGIVRVYAVLADGEEVVVAAQWAPGVRLAERLERARPPLSEAKPILRQLTSAVSHAHQHGVVLGDLRAEQVLVLDSVVKLASVGIAPALARTLYLEAVRETPAWARLAPEIRSGGPADPRADVYGLALLAVEMLTGKLPSRPLVLPDAPAPLATVLGRALADDPLLRHPSVDALAHDLEAVLSGGVVVQRSPLGRDGGERTPLLPTLPPLPTPTPQTSLAPQPAVDSAETETSRLPKQRLASDDEITGPELGDLEGVPTRVLGDQELDRLRGAEVTRQVSREEIFPLRVQSSETQQIELDMIEPHGEETDGPADDLDLEVEVEPDAEGTVRTAMPLPRNGQSGQNGNDAGKPSGETSDEQQTSQVPRVDSDGLDTMPVPRVEPELPPPPPAIPVESAPPLELPKPATAAMGGGTPTPLPPPAPPPTDDLGDATNRVARIAAPKGHADGAAGGLEPSQGSKNNQSGNTLAPRARELVIPDRPPTPDPALVLPKIQVELAMQAPPPAPPVDAVPRARRPTDEVPALPTPPSNVRVVIAMVIAFLVAATGIVIGVVRHMRELRLERERVETQRLAGELRARAEAIKRAGPVQPSTLTVTPAPIPTVPIVQSPCPLGANLLPGGKPFCIDVYEYPGGKTIPRTQVSFAEAEQLCGLRNERLCTDSEWERACRGKGGASYPYGSAFDAVRCNTRSGQVAAAGDYKECRAASGAYDMSGNVAEWVIARGRPAQKGGTALDEGQAIRSSRCSTTSRAADEEGGADVGFRCCADPR
jgi:serine/threonine protein kinase